MNANESFELFAKRFQARYHYLPFGKDTMYPPDVYTVLNDLAKTFSELEELKAGASLRTTSPIKAAVEDAKVQFDMAGACLNSGNIEKARGFLNAGIDRLNRLIKCDEQKQPTA